MPANRAVLQLALICCIAAGQQPPGGPDRAPTFKDYPVEHLYKGKVALPKFQKANLDKLPNPDGDFRCIGMEDGLRQLYFARDKVNFAGRYVIHGCACGTGCHYLFMWDAETGKVFRKFPFGRVEIDQFVDSKPSIDPGEHHRADSTLMIVAGCFDTDSHPGRLDCGRYFYNWTGENFVRVYKQRVPVPSAVAPKKP